MNVLLCFRHALWHPKDDYVAAIEHLGIQVTLFSLNLSHILTLQLRIKLQFVPRNTIHAKQRRGTV